MKDSPLMLLLPIVVIMGAVVFMFARDVLSPTHDDVTAEEKLVEVATSTTTEEVVEEKKSSPNNTSNIFRPKKEGESWTKRNLLLEAPCDFEEIENFADELLAKPEWAEVIKQYPNRTYTRHEQSTLDFMGASRWLHTCFVEVELTTNQVSSDEYNSLPYDERIKTWDVLPLLNNKEDYDDGFADVSLDDISFTALPADGPNSSSYGTYQYSNDAKRVRLFAVAHSGGGRMSVYEAEQIGEDPCPCSRSLTLKITNEISAEDIRMAIEKGKLPDGLGQGE